VFKNPVNGCLYHFFHQYFVSIFESHRHLAWLLFHLTITSRSQMDNYGHSLSPLLPIIPHPFFLCLVSWH
jgi:hypothetical protein